METMLLTPIGIVFCAMMLSLGLVTLLKLKRHRDLVEARLSRGLRQYASTAEREECTMVPSATAVLQ